MREGHREWTHVCFFFWTLSIVSYRYAYVNLRLDLYSVLLMNFHHFPRGLFSCSFDVFSNFFKFILYFSFFFFEKKSTESMVLWRNLRLTLFTSSINVIANGNWGNSVVWIKPSVSSGNRLKIAANIIAPHVTKQITIQQRYHVCRRYVEQFFFLVRLIH